VKNFIRMAQELSVLMNREYPGLSMPILNQVKKALYKQDADYMRQYIIDNSSDLVQYPVIYKYLKKEIDGVVEIAFIYD
jgi:hypothetical protein